MKAKLINKKMTFWFVLTLIGLVGVIIVIMNPNNKNMIDAEIKNSSISEIAEFKVKFADEVIDSENNFSIFKSNSNFNFAPQNGYLEEISFTLFEDKKNFLINDVLNAVNKNGTTFNAKPIFVESRNSNIPAVGLTDKQFELYTNSKRAEVNVYESSGNVHIVNAPNILVFNEIRGEPYNYKYVEIRKQNNFEITKSKRVSVDLDRIRSGIDIDKIYFVKDYEWLSDAIVINKLGLDKNGIEITLRFKANAHYVQDNKNTTYLIPVVVFEAVEKKSGFAFDVFIPLIDNWKEF